MMMPSILGENLFDDMMDFTFNDSFFEKRNPLFGKNEKNVMKTDVRETENSYELAIDLPGFKKENVYASLENGMLTIQAYKDYDNDEKDKHGKYIRRERYSGQCVRSFYIGEDIRKEDISAKFEDGILKLTVPKQQAAIEENNKFIAIEG